MTLIKKPSRTWIHQIAIPWGLPKIYLLIKKKNNWGFHRNLAWSGR